VTRRLNWSIVVFLPCALLVPFCGAAQESMGTPAAKAEFGRGAAAFRAQKYDVAGEAYKKAIALDPAYMEAHDQFIFVSLFPGKANEAASVARLEAIYRAWIKAHPKQAAYYWGLGYANFYKNPARCEEYCRKAVEIDPRLAKAWNTLSIIAGMKGDAAGALDNLRRAAAANPEDPSYLFYYSRQVIKRDPAAGVRLALEVVEKFPTSERAAQSLYWLGWDADAPAEQIEYFERLRKDFPPAKFSWSADGMSELVDLYASREPDKAVALAREIAAAMPDDKDWQATLAYQETMAKARALVAAKHGADAVALLEPLKRLRGSASTLLPLLLAEADASAGDAQKAYDRLARTVATEPDAELLEALNGYGAGLGKTSAQVDDELWALRVKQAKPAIPFKLATFDGRTRSLSDYKGKVFLLNFWYPG
jgi:tetratricopeptide (TPR) repeat protein